MKSQLENPEGLHWRYKITKLKVVKNPHYRVPSNAIPYGKRRTEKEFIVKEVAVDKNAEYFVLRLDEQGSDINHIKACRIAIHAYAEAINETIPGLSNDLLTQYPLL